MQPPQNPYNEPPLASPVGGSPFVAPGMLQNDSGTGPTAVLPAELKGVNVGAFFLNWIWAIAHSTWIGLLCFVPYVGVVMQFVLLFKGNEYAWQNRRWDSIEHFKEVQKKWQNWGIGLLVAGVVLGALAGILGGIAASRAPRSTTTSTTTTSSSSPQ